MTLSVPDLEQVKNIEESRILVDREYDSQKLVGYIYDHGKMNNTFRQKIKIRAAVQLVVI